MKKTVTLYLRLSFVFLCLISCIHTAYSCTCVYAPISFCAAADTSDIIIQAVVTGKPSNDFVEIKILENIHKEINADTILVLGQDGINCGQVLDIFNIGDTVIYSLYFDGLEDSENDETYFWYLDGCDVNYLRYEKDYVFGDLNATENAMSLTDFRHEILNCIDFNVSINDINDFSAIDVFPIPTHDVITIDSSKDIIEDIKVFNLSGLLLYQENDIRTSHFEIKTSHLKSGIYVLKIKTSQSMSTHKIVRY